MPWLPRLLPKTTPGSKVTIIPRGRALGVTMQLPEGDRYSMDKGPHANTISGAVRWWLLLKKYSWTDDHRRQQRLQASQPLPLTWSRCGMTDELGPMVYCRRKAKSSWVALLPQNDQHDLKRR